MLTLRFMRFNNLGNARHMSRRSTKGTQSVTKQQPQTVASPPPQAHPRPPGFWRTVMQDATSYAIGTAVGRVIYNGVSELFGGRPSNDSTDITNKKTEDGVGGGSSLE